MGGAVAVLCADFAEAAVEGAGVGGTAALAPWACGGVAGGDWIEVICAGGVLLAPPPNSDAKNPPLPDCDGGDAGATEANGADALPCVRVDFAPAESGVD